MTVAAAETFPNNSKSNGKLNEKQLESMIDLKALSD